MSVYHAAMVAKRPKIFIQRHNFIKFCSIHVSHVPGERDDAVGVGVVVPQARAEPPGVGQDLRHCQRHHCSSSGLSADQFIISNSFFRFFHTLFLSLSRRGGQQGCPLLIWVRVSYHLSMMMYNKITKSFFKITPNIN